VSCQFLEIPSTFQYEFAFSGVPEMKEKSVTKILESRGIRYSHRNDEILVPNTIEEQQMKKARKVREVAGSDEQPSPSLNLGKTPTG